MSSYSQYTGQSAGRILHVLDVYKPGLGFRVDEVNIGNGNVTYHNYHLANYSWKDDVPEFDFGIGRYTLGCFNQTNILLRKDLDKNQIVRQPFIDKPEFLFNINYVVQELKKVISIYDAETALFCIKQKSEEFIPDNLKIKVIAELGALYHKDLGFEEYWRHFIKCVLMNLELQ